MVAVCGPAHVLFREGSRDERPVSVNVWAQSVTMFGLTLWLTCLLSTFLKAAKPRKWISTIKSQDF